MNTLGAGLPLTVSWGAGPRRITLGATTTDHPRGLPLTVSWGVGPQQIRTNTPGVGPRLKTTHGVRAPLTRTISLGAAQPQKATRGAARRPKAPGQDSEPRRTGTDSATGPQLIVLGEDREPRRIGTVLATEPPPIAGLTALEELAPVRGLVLDTAQRRNVSDVRTERRKSTEREIKTNHFKGRRISKLVIRNDYRSI